MQVALGERVPPERYFFFFQAEDGIRDVAVTGVQTCALPISHPWEPHLRGHRSRRRCASDAEGRSRRRRLKGWEGPPLGVAHHHPDPDYRAGLIRIACPPPGASTRCRREVASTERLEIVTGSGLVSQFAPGPSA